jgi:hypothetical protein
MHRQGLNQPQRGIDLRSPLPRTEPSHLSAFNTGYVVNNGRQIFWRRSSSGFALSLMSVMNFKRAVGIDFYHRWGARKAQRWRDPKLRSLHMEATQYDAMLNTHVEDSHDPPS